jgi:hypothetical protein
LLLPLHLFNTATDSNPLHSNADQHWTEGNTSLLMNNLLSSSLTFTFCISVPFFLGESNGMTTGSLAVGLDGHVVRLRIGRKRLRKTWGKLHDIFVVSSLYCVDSIAIATLNSINPKLTPLDNTTDAFGTTDQCSHPSFSRSRH